MRHSKLPWLIAVIALVFALTGVSYGAAQRYIITQKNQIKPSVLRQLKGAKGARGLPGPQGAQGAQGGQGNPGAPGPAGVAKAWGTVVTTPGVAVVNNGGAAVTARNDSLGVYCLSVPAGSNPNQAIMVSSYGPIAIIAQQGRTGCGGNEYTVLTATIGGALTNLAAFNFLIP